MSVELFQEADWVKRELAIGARLVELGLPAFDPELVDQATEGGAIPDFRFVPAGLGRRQLLEACQKAGLTLYGGNAASADCDGDKLPTELGVFTLNYADIFMPDHDGSHHPFMLDYDGQREWATAQGGDGFTSVEECLYAAVLRPRVELATCPTWVGRSAAGTPAVPTARSASAGTPTTASASATTAWPAGAVISVRSRGSGRHSALDPRQTVAGSEL
ncbi:MAG: hypothetical protein Q7S80_03005 [bacterium]|nr:hypothetical protein [bacterium]